MLHNDDNIVVVLTGWMYGSGIFSLLLVKIFKIFDWAKNEEVVRKRRKINLEIVANLSKSSFQLTTHSLSLRISSILVLGFKIYKSSVIGEVSILIVTL